MYQRIINLDNDKLYDECLDIESLILKDHGHKTTGLELAEKAHKENGYPKFECGSKTAVLLHHYNLLDYSTKELEKLKAEIIKNFKDNIGVNGKFYLHTWLNVFRQDEFIGWHFHHKQGDKSWYGFYIVNGESSFTETPNEVVNSQNGLLTLEEMTSEMHRTSPWKGEKFRITIGYNIFPVPAENTIEFEIKD